jgi:hypothetical protein
MAPSLNLPVMTNVSMRIPLDVRATTPAGVPPLGVVPDLSDPPTTRYKLMAVESSLMAVMLLVASLRFYSASCVRRKLHADDCTVITHTISPKILLTKCRVNASCYRENHKYQAQGDCSTCSNSACFLSTTVLL